MKVCSHLLLNALAVLAFALSFSHSAVADSVNITSPASGAIYQNVDGKADINVTVYSDVPDGGVELILDMGTPEETSVRLASGDSTYTFISVPLGEHTIDAYTIDSLGNRLEAHDSKDHVGVGDIVIAMGDENVEGRYDDVTTDNYSADGRNGPVTDPSTGAACGGFEPILNDFLTSTRGYPHSVINVGHPGDTSAYARAAVVAAVAKYPNARIWLLSYGENDAYAGISSSTFRTNMLSAIAQIRAAVPNSLIYVSKVMYCTPSLALSYNKITGDIVRNLDGGFWGADLDTLFRGNASQFDRISGQAGTWLAKTTAPHPNGLGCQVMAKLWRMAIVDNAYLVSDGVVSSMGDVWADKISLAGLNRLGLSSNNLLAVCEQNPQIPPPPMGTVFSGGGWCVRLALTGATDFASGTLNATVRIENDNLPPIGATSWNQMWLSIGSILLPTSRKQNVTSKNNYDLTSVVDQPGQLSPVGDVTPPVTTCISNPTLPDIDGTTYSNALRISLSASDSTGFPVASTYYHWDSGSDTLYSGPIASIMGTHTLYFHSVDQSTNVEAVKSITFSVADTNRTVSISSPDNKALFQQIDGIADIPVTVRPYNVPSGGGVEVILDMGTQVEQGKKVYSSPYTCTFSGIPAGEHTVDAFMLSGTGTRLQIHDRKTQVGVGDIVVCMGDSITVGEVDDDYTDNWSADGRTGPYIDAYSGAEYGGYEPILNDLLTQARGYPQLVVNMGHAGDTSVHAVSKVAGIISAYPTARIWLVAYGTNDASRMSTSTYKQNLQTVIGRIQTAISGARVYLPKILYCTKTLVPDFHQAVGDIVRNTGNVYFGADLDTLFRGNHSLYDHLTQQAGTWLAATTTHHPNGIGCKVMAKLWKMALVDDVSLVSDGVMPTMGDLWADKIQLGGLDHIGLSESNLLTVSAQGQVTGPPPGTVFGGGGWGVKVGLTGASDFVGGTPSLGIRIEKDNYTLIGGTSWNQMWLARDSVLLPTTRQANSKNRNNYNLLGTMDHPGQITGAGDLTPPVTSCISTVLSASMVTTAAQRVTLNAVDGTGFPVAATYYHWDSASNSVYSGPFSIPSGTHVLHFHSVDQSGNVEADKTQTFTSP